MHGTQLVLDGLEFSFLNFRVWDGVEGSLCAFETRNLPPGSMNQKPKAKNLELSNRNMKPEPGVQTRNPKHATAGEDRIEEQLEGDAPGGHRSGGPKLTDLYRELGLSTYEWSVIPCAADTRNPEPKA